MTIKLVTEREPIDRDKLLALTDDLESICMNTDAFACLVTVLCQSERLDEVGKGMLWNMLNTVTHLNERLHHFTSDLFQAVEAGSAPEPTI